MSGICDFNNQGVLFRCDQSLINSGPLVDTLDNKMSTNYMFTEQSSIHDNANPMLFRKYVIDT